MGTGAPLYLDPSLADAVAAFPLPTITAELLPLIRNGGALGEPPPLSGRVAQSDHVVNTANGVSVRVHKPIGVEGARPCVFGIHGGGLIIGSNTMQDAEFDHWCDAFGIVGVSVEYRLAPEHPYPAALDDCYEALAWTFANAADLGIDTARIGIQGTSAGGGLAAALALLARDRGEFALAFQLLECPMIDDRQITASSQLEGLFIWTKGSNTFGWQSYLGPLYGTDEVPAYAAAARATDLTGLPPAYVCVGGADGFRDENIDYAMRLSQAGVPTELHVYPGAPHGAGLFAHADVAKRYVADLNGWLGRQVAT